MKGILLVVLNERISSPSNLPYEVVELSSLYLCIKRLNSGYSFAGLVIYYYYLRVYTKIFFQCVYIKCLFVRCYFTLALYFVGIRIKFCLKHG